MDIFINLYGEIGFKVGDKAFRVLIPNKIPSSIASNWLLEKIEQTRKKVPIIREWTGVII
jgi:hypothetical protein